MTCIFSLFVSCRIPYFLISSSFKYILGLSSAIIFYPTYHTNRQIYFHFQLQPSRFVKSMLDIDGCVCEPCLYYSIKTRRIGVDILSVDNRIQSFRLHGFLMEHEQFRKNSWCCFSSALWTIFYLPLYRLMKCNGYDDEDDSDGDDILDDWGYW